QQALNRSADRGPAGVQRTGNSGCLGMANKPRCHAAFRNVLPKNREFNREFRKKPGFARRSDRNSAAASIGFRQIPYAAEQGIFAALQGIGATISGFGSRNGRPTWRSSAHQTRKYSASAPARRRHVVAAVREALAYGDPAVDAGGLA